MRKLLSVGALAAASPFAIWQPQPAMAQSVVVVRHHHRYYHRPYWYHGRHYRGYYYYR